MRQKSLILLLVVLFAGCKNGRQYFPKQVPPAEINIVRFDSALLSIDALSDSVKTDILRLYDEYPDFMSFYSEQILGIEAADTAFMLEALPKYLTDTIYHFAEVNRQTRECFRDISGIRREMNAAFGKIRYLYPEWQMPELTFFVSGFNASLLFWEASDLPLQLSTGMPLRIAVGADMYLGTDYEYYNRVVWNYQKQTMRKECIPADVVSAYLFRMLPFTSSKSRLLENMLYRGKVMYLLSELFAEQADYEIMGYSKEQWEWAEKNERGVWQMMVDKRDLWKTESPVLTSYLNDGPFTAEISQDAPPRLGTFIGWHIARSYMENNPDVTMRQLMEEGDAQKVLEMSHYKP
ncbi:MAG: hypothetical protein IJ776_06300 [Paludibacteraceae bacterium]|nr:hypothetical protein [Paludibacteraceae bacterium]